MNRSHLWKFLFLIFTIIWAVKEITPPTANNLIDQFNETATVGRDANLTAIVESARTFEKQFPTRGSYSNLMAAIGTNSIARYFPAGYVATNLVVTPGNERLANRAAINRVQKEAAGQIRLGLDLQGGVQFTMEMQPVTNSVTSTNGIVSQEEQALALDQAVEVLRSRVDRYGVAEPLLQKSGANRIVVQLPGLSDSQLEEAQATISKAAFLEFRMVDPEMAQHLAAGIYNPPGYILKEMKVTDKRTGKTGTEPIIIKRAPELGMTGEYVKDTGVSRDSMTGMPEIQFELNSEGAEKFATITRENVGKALAILLDGEVISAPRINSPILGGRGVIQGQFSDKEAFDLASNLKNPLKAPLETIESGSVGASLGADSVAAGIKAALYGTIAVAIFMLIYYMIAGVVANVAMLLNILLLLGVMCSLDVTLTLPGIAGIVLTIGMAVDANVLIFERIREETEAGKSIRGAVAAGYDRAFGTIFDSNLTTLISSVLLIILGTGTIKGFGIALTIGLMVSMFTSLAVTRLIFDFLLARGWLKSLPMLHLIRGSKIDFMSFAKPAFIASWILIICGCGYGIFRGHDILGTDFAGGDTLTLAAKQGVTVDQGTVEKIRSTVDTLQIGASRIQSYRSAASQQDVVQIITRFKSGADVEKAINSKLPEMGFARKGLEQTGPTIGVEIQKSAVLAVIFALFGILVYVAFRYEFSFAIGAVVAIIHDLLMTIGCYSLTGLFGEGRQFNATFVAALLTIIGFSINDTIVIFDRIREDLKLGVKGTFRDVINAALNQTLSRTVITSGTVFIATMSLYLFAGNGEINDFAFTFLVGILTGTYSSIYIASALVWFWHKGERPKLGGATSSVTLAEADGSTVKV